MDHYLLFNFDDTITEIPYGSGFNTDEIPEGTYIYSFHSKKWFLRLHLGYSWWHDKQPEDVPKQHRAALLIYS